MADKAPTGATLVPFAEVRSAEIESGLLELVADHRMLRILCGRLEAMADDLPVLPPAGRRRRIAHCFATLLRQHHDREMSLLRQLCRGDAMAQTGPTLMQRISLQHTADRAQAQELISALEEAGTGHGREQAEALGYMLRCCFDGCRRELAFEELTMLTLARYRVSPEAAALLLSGLTTNPGC